jgi:hypothetical protein
MDGQGGGDNERSFQVHFQATYPSLGLGVLGGKHTRYPKKNHQPAFNGMHNKY